MAPPQLDRVCLSDTEASVGDRVVSSAQRRCLLWALRVTSDGEFRAVLHVACDLQKAPDDGGDHLQSQALLALCGFGSAGITSTFIGYEWENHMLTG